MSFNFKDSKPFYDTVIKIVKDAGYTDPHIFYIRNNNNDYFDCYIRYDTKCLLICSYYDNKYDIKLNHNGKVFLNIQIDKLKQYFS